MNLPEGRILIFDGAMGTMLLNDPAVRLPVESLSQSSPELVALVHREYIRAGAQVIRTNTFGANRLNLSMYSLEQQVVALNERAVELARDAAAFATGPCPIIVAGSIGPVDQQAFSFTRVNCSPKEAYAEQAQALIEAGVGMLVCETFQTTADIEELLGAVLPLAKRGKKCIPVALCITPIDDFDQAAEFAVTLFESIVSDSGVDFFGFNCGSGPESVVKPIMKMRKDISIPLLALPSAGIPVIEGNRVRYPVGIDEFSSQLRALADTKLVAGIGGCCGTTPDYIAALAALNSGRSRN